MDAEPRTDDVVEPTLEDPAEIARQREERANRRMRQTVRDMLLSMAVVTGVVVLMVLPWNRGNPDPVHVIDATPVVQGARSTESWQVLAPQGLPAGWRATSARISTASDGQDIVHLGYLTPATAYVGLEQSATKALTFVSESTVDGKQTGTAEVGGRTWQRYEAPDGLHRSLARAADGVTYVVTGTAEWSQLELFARSLVAG